MAQADDSARTQPQPQERPKLATTVDRARHAALVRWGKQQPFRARLEAIREARKKGKGKGKAKGSAKKPKLTAAQRAAQREQERAANVAAMGAMLDDADNAFLSSRGLDGLASAANGEEPRGPIADGLIEKGLAVRGEDGRFRLTSDGRALLHAAESGDQNALLDRISEQNDKDVARQKKEADKLAKEEEKKKGGGGGGGGKEKPTEEEKAKAKADARAQTASETAKQVGLKQDELDTLRQSAEQGAEGLTMDHLRRLEALGLTSDGETTDQGRRALNALERGDVRAYRAALQDARARMARERAADERRRARDQGTTKAIEDTMPDILDTLPETLAGLTADLEALGDADEAIKAGRRNNAGDQATLDAAYEMAGELQDALAALGANTGEEDDELPDAEDEGMEDMAGKAQRTFGGKERADIEDSDFAGPDRTYPIMTAQDVKDAARLIGKAADPEAVKRKIIAIAKRKGFADAIPEAWLGATKKSLATKGIEFLDDDTAILEGYSVKAIGQADGWVGGYLVRFGGDGDLSEWRDMFTKQTDFGRATKSDVWVHHRMLPGVGKRRLTNQAEIGMDDEGVFIKHLLDLRSAYERKLYELAQADKLGWSSGTAPHLVDRKALGDGRHQIDQWPLGLDASYTPMPAGGLGVEARAGAMKSLFADAGIDLLHAIYDDNPEAPEAPSQSADGRKGMDDDRARRLLLDIDLLLLSEEPTV